MRLRCLFLIQPLRNAKAAVRHAVFGMVWTSPRQARHKSVAANVEHWVKLQEVSSECTSRCCWRRSFRKSQRWSTSYVQTTIGENFSWKALGVMIHQCAVCTYILIMRGVCIEPICNMYSSCVEFVSNLSVMYKYRVPSLYGTYMYLCINHVSSLYRTYL